ILEEHGVAVIISSPYHPQGNGIAECDGQTLKNAILKACSCRAHDWPLYLNAALLVICTMT
ncbi:hypothetical protein WOLCODRAFT_52221, partial [Wolfiporia cocos MD-104 SS10]